MQKQPFIYLAVILLIVLVFWGGFYFISYQSQKEIAEKESVEEITANSEPLLKTTLELKPEQYDRDELLDAQIIAINLDNDPKEIDANINLVGRFSDPPVPSLRKTILVDKNTNIGIGRFDKIGFDELIDITELRVGDQLLVFVVESTLDLLEREQYTAYGIKVLLIEDLKTE